MLTKEKSLLEAVKDNALMKWLKALYHWVMSWEQHPWGLPVLCFLAAIEAIFFPLPVDPLIISMGAARPKRAPFYAFLATSFSTLGALGGYALGFWLWGQVSSFFFQYVFSPEAFHLVMHKFSENAFMAMLLAGLTPLPFKVFTVSAGVASLPLGEFLVGTFVGRGLRFMALGFVFYCWGQDIREKLEKNFEIITLLTGVLLVLFFVVYKFLF
ncbi:MAG: DedA family protein [Bdellovibrio sp.]|nr:MAG: DedA family protein [Bdellovibrio sp.]